MGVSDNKRRKIKLDRPATGGNHLQCAGEAGNRLRGRHTYKEKQTKKKSTINKNLARPETFVKMTHTQGKKAVGAITIKNGKGGRGYAKQHLVCRGRLSRVKLAWKKALVHRKKETAKSTQPSGGKERELRIMRGGGGPDLGIAGPVYKKNGKGLCYPKRLILRGRNLRRSQ